MRRASTLGLVCALAQAWALAAPAQVVFDGSLGPAGPAPTRTDLPGFDLDYQIAYDERDAVASRHGALLGANLYQSLEELSIPQPPGSSTSATFRALDAAGNPLGGIRNVIARVTGGKPSAIEGVLRSEIPGADLFLLNPAGVVFRGGGLGTRNQLDLPASFFASSADFLRFEDGTLFEVAELADPQLSISEPSAFGFLAGNQGRVLLDDRALLRTPAGASIAFVASEIEITGESTVEMPGGAGQLAAVGAAALGVPVAVDTWAVAGAAPGSLGEIAITMDSKVRETVDGAADPGSRIVFRGGRLVVDDSLVEAAGVDGIAGMALDAVLADEIVARNDSRLQTFGQLDRGIGEGRLVTRRLEVRDTGTRVGIVQSGLAEGAAFRIAADEVLVTDTGVVTTLNRSSQTGAPLLVDAGSLEVRDGGRVETATVSTPATGGLVDISADSVVVSRSDGAASAGVIRSLSVFGGDGGDIRIRADPGSVLLDGTGVQIESSSSLDGDGGDIRVETGTLTIQGGAQITSRTTSDKGAGDVGIEVGGTFSIVGDGADPAVPSGVFATTGLQVGTPNLGNAGRVGIEARDLEMSGNAAIATLSRNQGAAGDIVIVAEESLGMLSTADGIPGISAATRDGPGGSIGIETQLLTLRDGSFISSSTFQKGQAGPVSIEARRALLSGAVGANTSAILSESFGQALEVGDAGQVTLVLGETLEVVNGAEISVESRGPGAAGSIRIEADESVTIAAGGSVSATAEETGESGDVTIEAPVIILDAGSVTTEAADGTASGAEDDPIGGNISLTAGRHVGITAGSLVSAQSNGTQDAGRITIDAGRDLFVADSEITTDASEETANAAGGQIDITATNEIELLRSTVSTSVQAFEGDEDGGDITIDPRFVIVNRSDILAQAIFGDGGKIDITAGTYLESADSTVNASSLGGGIDGEVNVDAPDTELKGQLTRLPSHFLDATALLREHCAARASGRGSFVVAGREGGEASPVRPLPARMPLPEETGPGGTARHEGAPHDAGAADLQLRLAALDCEALARRLEREGLLP